MTLRLTLALAGAGLALVAGSGAHAQSVMTPGAMPPPPSFRDSQKEPAQGQTRRARKPAEARAGEPGEQGSGARRTGRAAAGTSRDDMSGRIDTRPARADSRRMELEDDPRAVAPIMNNGRAGVGMRF